MDRSCFRWSWYSPRLPLSKDERSDCEEDELGKKGRGGHSFSFRTLSGLRGGERVLGEKRTGTTGYERKTMNNVKYRQ